MADDDGVEEALTHGLARRDQVTHSGLPNGVVQTWSVGHPVAAAGIAYHTRRDGSELCYALVDRSADAIVEDARDVEPDRDGFWQIADHYRVGLAA